MKKNTLIICVFALCIQMTNAQVISKDETSYIPKVFGLVKAKYEMSGYDGYGRFNVRDARLGVKGMASARINYALQVDFHNEGKVSVLDAYAAYNHNNFDISLGQQQHRFSTDMGRSPAENIFANRTLLGKFITNYYNAEVEGSPMSLGSLGSRDMGIISSYVFNVNMPIKVTLGLFNGSGINAPEWREKQSLTARIDLGGKRGLSGGLSYFDGFTPLIRGYANALGPQTEYIQKMRICGVELRYKNDRLFIESEFAARQIDNDKSKVFKAGFVQGYYKFNLNKGKTFNQIAPTARLDMVNNLDFQQTPPIYVDSFSGQRLTAGVNFIRKNAELRLNIERYVFDNEPSNLNINRLFQDKITIEAVVTF